MAREHASDLPAQLPLPTVAEPEIRPATIDYIDIDTRPLPIYQVGDPVHYAKDDRVNVRWRQSVPFDGAITAFNDDDGDDAVVLSCSMDKTFIETRYLNKIISYHHLTSSSHIIISYHHLVSSSHIIILYHHLISSSRIIITYHHLISSSHIIISCDHLISSYHIIISSSHSIISYHHIIIS